MPDQTLAIELHPLLCSTCGVYYGIPKVLYDSHQEGRGCESWHCPNGHSQQTKDRLIDRITKERDKYLEQRNAAQIESVSLDLRLGEAQKKVEQFTTRRRRKGKG